ncbi:DUF3054 domain-containing protein [Actinomadura sp. 7K507]|uniref:DUF3054 domain-containing protein n=1 Tax=Actinomadura sp. 7K507 TaxID=2530365 RepID=UPI001052F8E5|nr:DUF3054 domain-containing protein [Actinomadura sp. 7K507]TDC80462.1 DUF3054 domain-containing protein [Actinomadura sp. 7K507]
MRGGVAGLVDVCCVLVFVAIGRATHEDAASLTGYLATVWPFLVALGVGWGVSRAWRGAEVLWPVGVVVWATTVAGGMALRALSGDGTAVAFVIVATLFLALTLLGWRLVTRFARVRAVSRQG